MLEAPATLEIDSEVHITTALGHPESGHYATTPPAIVGGDVRTLPPGITRPRQIWTRPRMLLRGQAELPVGEIQQHSP